MSAEISTFSTHPHERRTIVLKFGGSVLAREDDIASAVHECYRWVREGWSVVAVVSAIGDTTDRLVAAASSYGHDPSSHAAAALVATGETVSAAHLWLGCDRAGIDAVSADPREIGLRVEGPATDARPVSVDEAALRALLRRHAVVVVPGFFGVDGGGRIALLGRGGSDLTAVLVAHALGARCRLVKDVPGLFEHDPARPGPFARRYATITFADAERIDGAILQRKALAYAMQHAFPFEVGAAAQAEASLVGAEETRFAGERAHARLRVALLGFGVVGRGVWQHLARQRHAFEVVGAAVRSPKRHSDAIAPRLLKRDAVLLAADESSDVVVETIGGLTVARAAVKVALRRGADVVTANKTLLAHHGAELAQLAEESGARIYASAAVGGAAPMLETAARLREQGVARVEAVLNGTTNFVLGARASGVSFDDAVAEAQALGFAESDPSADLSGADAEEKLRILCRAAFGCDPDLCTTHGLDRHATVRGSERLVARAILIDGSLVASIAVEELRPTHPLLSAQGVWNQAVFTLQSGESVPVSGKGAGRFPTAEAVLADLFDAHRARAERRHAERPHAQLAGGVA
jgi:homoserine dehydrogenase